MSYKAEVIADSSGTWCGNGLAFATEVEAQAYVQDLMWRWTAVRETRVVESQEPVSHRYEAQTKRIVNIEQEMKGEIEGDAKPEAAI
jgi:hypothetical protein